MQRYSTKALHAVTSLPALVPCKPGDEDGFVDGTAVRVVTTKHIRDAAKNKRNVAPLGLSLEDWRIITGTKLLLRANELRDLKAAQEGATKLVGTRAWKVDDPKNSRVAALALAWGSAEDDGWQMSWILNSILSDSRACFWLRGKLKDGAHPQFTGAPERGMFCKTMTTAVAFKMWFNGIRICLRCHDLFLGERNKDYCSVQCRETHRVARWRERQRANRKAREQ